MRKRALVKWTKCERGLPVEQLQTKEMFFGHFKTKTKNFDISMTFMPDYAISSRLQGQTERVIVNKNSYSKCSFFNPFSRRRMA